MRRNWEHFLRAKPSHRRTRKNAVRDIDIWRAILVRYETTRIPRKLNGKFLSDLAREHKLKIGHAKKIISELREIEANPWAAHTGGTSPTPTTARKVTFGR